MSPIKYICIKVNEKISSEFEIFTGTMAECLVVIGALSTATAEKLASGNRSRSKNELFCTVIVPEIESTLKLTL